MVDYQLVANQIKEAEWRIRDNFVEIGVLDYRRVEHFHDYFTKGRREDLERFLKETRASKLLLQNIKRDFNMILEHVSLVEELTKKDKQSQNNLRSTMRRAGYMRSLLYNFLSQRRTQVIISKSLLSTKNPIDNIEFLKKSLSYLQEKRLIVSVGKEKDLVLRFEGFFKQEKERIDAAFQNYLNEHKKDSTAETSLILIVLAPIVGSALALAVDDAFQWANRYSINHKMLKPVSPRRQNGLTV